MPLAFNSANKGEIAFGFFNIETDMLLLENYFFFASDFCKLVCTIFDAKKSSSSQLNLNGYIISDIEKIGNLMGAIHGTIFTGFIGEIYKKFPFPKDLKNFKQNPEGYKNRGIIENIIQKYSSLTTIPVYLKDDKIAIGDYEFTKEQFSELINYVWLGGYPRWKDEIRPDYVIEMKKIIELFKYNNT